MESFFFTASDGHEVACYSWLADNPQAVIQIAHGMGEHAKRYDWVGTQLADHGFAVCASDHRGHGKTAGTTAGYMGPDGWNRNLADLYELNQRLRSQHPGLKHCLLGHSMGAMLSQQYITRYGHSIDALVLSGSPGFKDARFSFINGWIMKFEHWRLGPDQPSALMQKAVFGDANKPFDLPGASGYEWLSRDPEQVQQYVEDDDCGFVLTMGSLIDMMQGSGISQNELSIDKIPQELPVYVFSGAEDPVHGEQLDLERMIDAYRKRGLSQLEVKLYPGGRHEMFNETNRQEVVSDLLAWLDKHL